MDIGTFVADLCSKTVEWETVDKWLAALHSTIEHDPSIEAFLCYLVTFQHTRRTVFRVLSVHVSSAAHRGIASIPKAFGLLKVASLIRNVATLSDAAPYRDVLTTCMHRCPKAAAVTAAANALLEVPWYLETLSAGAPSSFYEGLLGVLLADRQDKAHNYTHLSNASRVMVCRMQDRVATFNTWMPLLSEVITAMRTADVEGLQSLCALVTSLAPAAPVIEGAVEAALVRYIKTQDPPLQEALLGILATLASYPPYAFRLQSVIALPGPLVVKRDPEANTLVVASALDARSLFALSAEEVNEALRQVLTSLTARQKQLCIASCAKATGKSHAVDISGNTTVADLKQDLKAKLGVGDGSLFNIEWEGSVLGDKDVLAALGMVADDDVHVVPSEKAEALEALREVGTKVSEGAMEAAVACENGLHIFTLLCKAGVVPSHVVFGLVCNKGSLDLLKVTCEYMPSPVPPAIAEAALRTNVEFVTYMMKHVTFSDKHDETLLHMAVTRNAPCDIIECLLKYCDPNACELSGNTPLHYAAMFYYTPIAEILLGHPRIRVSPKTDDQTTPMHYAAMGRLGTPIVKLLAERGADMNVTEIRGWTPLHCASFNNVPATVKLLLSQGADICAKTFQGELPLHLAAGNGCREIIDLLMAEGADINATDNKGRTALHHAALKFHPYTMTYLETTYNADPTLTDVADKTAQQSIPKTYMRPTRT